LPAQNTGLALYYLAHDRAEEAFQHAAEIQTPDIPHGYALRATCLVRLGRKAEASAEAARLLRLPSRTGRGALATIMDGNAHADVVAMLAAAFREAGLPADFVRN
jgi:hypothetical protein